MSREGDLDQGLPGAAAVPVGSCIACGRRVVLWQPGDGAQAGPGVVAHGEAGGVARWACAHCDGPVEQVAWVDESELGDLGYVVRDPLESGCAGGCAGGACGRASRG